ncbi:DUF2812 domain-containing protein [Clostridium sp.]|uniref:DUF2812 domain-containing protein n=1 Tax=Clostridium sp. TaxID=1506 RepID=UPI001A3C8E77|nr:DUF2812 domain-containing protein [Clostridium sp.]MBK5239717.1 DUF2812 domain-containing protein [Clostridium sp.]
MWNKNTKRTFFTFLPYECAAAEEYLELMAEKGWLLQSVKGKFYKFKKTQMKNIKYSVDVLHKVSIFDHKDSDVALEYREYCKAAGWIYVCQIGKIQIFYTEADNKTISIHTDEEEKFKSVFKASLYSMGSQFFITILCVFNLYMQLFIADTGFALATNMGILSIVGMGSLVLMNSIGFVSFLLWVTKVRAKLKKDIVMNYSNYKQVRQKNIFRSSVAVIYFFILLKLLIFDNLYSKGFSITFLIIMCIPIIIMIFVRKFINKKRYAKNINMGITIGSVVVSTYVILILVVSVILFSGETLQNEVPTQKFNLTTVDFGFVGNNDESPYINFDKSIIAQRVDYSGGNDDNYLRYTIFQSDYPLVVKFYEDRLLSKLNSYDTDLLEQKTKLPNNIVVYSDSEKRMFVLVSEDKVVKIIKDFINITEEEFLNKVYKKLY